MGYNRGAIGLLLPVHEEEHGELLIRQKKQREKYTAAACERLQVADDCQFSLLPYQELRRTAGVWFDAANEALMRANYGPLDALIREQVRVASEQGFELTDLLQLLRLLRQVAIEEENWNEEHLAEMDTVVDEAMAALRGKVTWDIPEGLNYLTGKTRAELQREQLQAEAVRSRSERRRFGRNKLRLPIRIRGFLPDGLVNEITRTENVAKGGLYFLSEHPFYRGARLHVIYPYWNRPGDINPECEAEVVRVDERQGQRGVAVRFLSPLGKPPGRR
jgi:hypothetical protein